MKYYFFIIVVIFSSSLFAANNVLLPGTLYTNDMKNYGQLHGSEWYAVSLKNKAIKKAKLFPSNEISYLFGSEGSPDAEGPYIEIPVVAEATMYIRGVSVKEGKINGVKFGEKLSEEPNELGVPNCTIYYKGSEPKSKNVESGEMLGEKELLVKCGANIASVLKHTFAPDTDYPYLEWTADINGDGFPDLVLGEDRSTSHLLMSEKTKDGFKYIKIGHVQHQGC